MHGLTVACTALVMAVASDADAAPVELLDDDGRPADARAVALGVPLRFGAFVGWHATPDDFDVLGERRADQVADPGPAFGLRLGWRIARGWALDGTLGLVPAGSEWLVPALAELRWRPLEGHGFTPSVAVGGGVYGAFGAGSDADLLVSFSAGVEIELGRVGSVRVDLGAWGTDAIASTLAWTPVVTLGFDLFGWREHGGGAKVVGVALPRVTPPPRGCPRGVHVERCTDSDGDGVVDAFDACALESGSGADAALGGCPDSDRDGVVPPREACPSRPGASIDWGCPR